MIYDYDYDLTKKIYDCDCINSVIPVLWVAWSHIVESGCANHKYILSQSKFLFETVLNFRKIKFNQTVAIN